MYCQTVFCFSSYGTERQKSTAEGLKLNIKKKLAAHGLEPTTFQQVACIWFVWPVIQLYSDKKQPIFGDTSIHRGASGWIRWAEDIVTKAVGSSPTGGAAFFMEKISNLPKHN